MLWDLVKDQSSLLQDDLTKSVNCQQDAKPLKLVYRPGLADEPRKGRPNVTDKLTAEIASAPWIPCREALEYGAYPISTLGTATTDVTKSITYASNFMLHNRMVVSVAQGKLRRIGIKRIY